MRSLHAQIVALLVLVFLAAGVVRGEPAGPARPAKPPRVEDDPKRTYDELFGAEEKRVANSSTKADDAAFAQKLMASSASLSDSPKLRVVLYEKAYEFGVKAYAGFAAAAAALDQLDQDVPDRSAEWQAKRLELLNQQYKLAAPSERKDVGEKLASQLMVVGDAAAAKEQWTEAAELYQRAVNIATTVGSSVKDEAGEKLATCGAMKQAEQLKAKVKTEGEGGASRMQLIKLYVIQADDPAKAVPYLDAGVDEAWRTYVPMAAKDMSRLEPQACLELGNWYKTLATTASGTVKANLAQRAQAYYRQYLSKAPASTGVERLQLEQARATINAAMKELGITAVPRQLALADPAVKQAFDKGVAWLWSAQNAMSGSWNDSASSMYSGSSHNVDGTVAATWALMEATGSVGDPRISKALRYLNLHNTMHTNGVATRLCLWGTCERLRPGTFGSCLRSDLRVLLVAAREGAAYSYSVYTGSDYSRENDSGHTAYGQMGVAAATAVGYKPPPKYWMLVRDYWAKSQNGDGGWGRSYSYSDSSSRSSSGQCTFAAVANLAFALQQIHGESSLATMVGADFEPLKKGMKWMDQFACKAITGQYPYGSGPWHETYLFLGRAGRLLGKAKFGNTDWFEQGAKELVKRQNAEGSWGGTTQTAHAILFLVNGGRTVETAMPAGSGGEATAVAVAAAGGGDGGERAGARKKLDSLLEKYKAGAAEATAKEIVRVYLIELQDVAGAAGYAGKSGESSWPGLLAAAGKELEDVNDADALGLGDLYRELSSGAAAGARKAALRKAASYYQRFLDLHTGGDVKRLKAQLAMDQIKKELKE